MTRVVTNCQSCGKLFEYHRGEMYCEDCKSTEHKPPAGWEKYGFHRLQERHG